MKHKKPDCFGSIYAPKVINCGKCDVVTKCIVASLRLLEGQEPNENVS